MNVYEEAHNLAQAIKESNEFKEFDALRKEVEKDETLNSMLKDFQMKQFQIQTRQMTGESPDNDMMAQLQSLYTLIASKPQAAQYLQAEARFSIMMKDVAEILGNAVNIQSMY